MYIIIKFRKKCISRNHIYTQKIENNINAVGTSVLDCIKAHCCNPRDLKQRVNPARWTASDTHVYACMHAYRIYTGT